VLTHATAVLDTYPYGGCLTALDALAHAIPIVTLPSPYIRGRYAVGEEKREVNVSRTTTTTTTTTAKALFSPPLSRFTLALYRQLGVMDCVATTPEEYVSIAIRLDQDPPFRESVVAQLISQHHLLPRTEEVAAEWESLFLRLARQIS